MPCNGSKNMKSFSYGETEISYLTKQDPVLGLAIQRIGLLDNAIMPDLFTAIVFNIISQQISFKAAETVWKRVTSAFASYEYCNRLTASEILSFSEKNLQSMGMSWRKSSHIRQIAQACVEGELVAEELSKLSDEEIRHNLIQLPGVGNWTVDMLMIFSLERKDILSWHDLAIRRGIMRLHRLEELTREQHESYRRLYSPYGTIASFYLWEIAHESTE